MITDSVWHVGSSAQERSFRGLRLPFQKSCTQTEEVLVSEKAGVPVKNLRKQKYSNAKVLRLLSDPSENI